MAGRSLSPAATQRSGATATMLGPLTHNESLWRPSALGFGVETTAVNRSSSVAVAEPTNLPIGLIIGTLA
jgi:hypothetical protein